MHIIPIYLKKHIDSRKCAGTPKYYTTTESEFLKICEDYGVPNDPMRYRDEKFYWTYRCSISWPDDYIGPDSMTRWIIEKLVGFTDVGLLRILVSVRTYAYLILSSQASARSGIVGNTVSALTA